MHQNILNPKRDFTIIVQGYTLFGLIPLPKEELAIDLNVSRRLEGQPLQSIPKQTYQYVLMAETLNIAIREKPEALANLADWMDFPDPEFVTEAYEQYIKKQSEFYAGLKKNSGGGSTETPVQPERNDGPVHPQPVQNSPVQPGTGQPVSGTEVVPDRGGVPAGGHVQHNQPSPGFPASPNVRVPQESPGNPAEGHGQQYLPGGN